MKWDYLRSEQFCPNNCNEKIHSIVSSNYWSLQNTLNSELRACFCSAGASPQQYLALQLLLQRRRLLLLRSCHMCWLVRRQFLHSPLWRDATTIPWGDCSACGGGGGGDCCFSAAIGESKSQLVGCPTNHCRAHLVRGVFLNGNI